MLAADAARGPAAMRRYGCGTCHAIPGVPGANGVAGPSLAGYGERVYIAGVLPNDFANLVRWIRHPQSILPGTAMPDVGASEQAVHDMVAYLYLLRVPSDPDGWHALPALLRSR